ncbi:MAG: uracil phosphoribosyltransferase [Bacteroidales bacterium]|jgi:uracil phosphoribosyltransferase|nr:uracil phosphoribosyltransferase [Bacteroidales bacterium]
MKIVDFSKTNSVINKYICEMRDVNIQSDRMRFRRNVERLGSLMAYEVSKELQYEKQAVTTPLGIAECSVPAERLVVAAILRAGLPLHQGVIDVFDDAENAFVSAYRKYDEDFNFDIHIEYIASPTLDGKTLLICDPMLATGGSMQLAYEALLTKGTPARVHVLSVIASHEALEYLAENMPSDTVVWVGAVDNYLNQHKYIVPGLGDAGDLAFGEKE